jgi:hypothetical protein
MGTTATDASPGDCSTCGGIGWVVLAEGERMATGGGTKRKCRNCLGTGNDSQKGSVLPDPDA